MCEWNNDVQKAEKVEGRFFYPEPAGFLGCGARDVHMVCLSSEVYE
jgi:hypothetical protein